jgi:hypothetical protein
MSHPESDKLYDYMLDSACPKCGAPQSLGDTWCLECREKFDSEDCRLGPDCKCEACREETENFNPKI